MAARGERVREVQKANGEHTILTSHDSLDRPQSCSVHRVENGVITCNIIGEPPSPLRTDRASWWKSTADITPMCPFIRSH